MLSYMYIIHDTVPKHYHKWASREYEGVWTNNHQGTRQINSVT